MSRLFNNLLKVAGAGVLLYGVYKLGQKNTFGPMDEETVEEDKPKTEIDMVHDMIQELRRKINKTKRDKDNIELLEIKLKQLENQK